MTEPVISSRRRLLRWGKFAAQLAILALVGWGIWRTMAQARGDLVKEGVKLRDLHLGWLSIAGVVYLLGMLLWSNFWYQVLLTMRQRPHRWDALRAYFVSQPGKYVPGKFMVVFLRSAMIRSKDVDVTLATAASFVETLTIMSIGAVVGAVLLPVVFAGDWRLIAFAIASALGVGIPVLPPVFRRVVKLTQLHRLHPEIDRSLEGLTIRGLAAGWGGIVISWFAMGVSLWATLQAMPAHLKRPIELADIPLLTACGALSTVAGFVSGLPGGLGAHEWVVTKLIIPHFGVTAAVLSAVINRVVMIVAELAAGGLLLAAKRTPPDTES